MTIDLPMWLRTVYNISRTIGYHDQQYRLLCEDWITRFWAGE